MTLTFRGKESVSPNTAIKMRGNGRKVRQTDVRNVIQGLTPVEPEVGGLLVAMQRLCDQIQSRTNIECRLIHTPVVEFSDNEISTQLFRIAQESINS